MTEQYDPPTSAYAPRDADEAPAEASLEADVGVDETDIIARQTIWERLWRWFRPGEDDDETRLISLTHAIEMYPDAPSNYVLRGEWYLKRGDIDAAVDDFQQAITLADAQYETSRWGIVAQTTRDRALEGLSQVHSEKHFRGKSNNG